MDKIKVVGARLHNLKDFIFYKGFLQDFVMKKQIFLYK